MSSESATRDRLFLNPRGSSVVEGCYGISKVLVKRKQNACTCWRERKNRAVRVRFTTIIPRSIPRVERSSTLVHRLSAASLSFFLSTKRSKVLSEIFSAIPRPYTFYLVLVHDKHVKAMKRTSAPASHAPRQTVSATSVPTVASSSPSSSPTPATAPTTSLRSRIAPARAQENVDNDREVAVEGRNVSKIFLYSRLCGRCGGRLKSPLKFVSLPFTSGEK